MVLRKYRRENTGMLESIGTCFAYFKPEWKPGSGVLINFYHYPTTSLGIIM